MTKKAKKQVRQRRKVEPEEVPAPAAKVEIVYQRSPVEDKTRYPHPMLLWWYKLQFRRALKRTRPDYGVTRGWRRRCLTVVSDWKGPGHPFPPVSHRPTGNDMVETLTERVHHAIERVVHFWRWHVSNGWLDDAA